MATPTLLQDVYDGTAIRRFVLNDPRFGSEPRNAMLVLFCDPFQPFKDDAKYSLTPFLVTLLNGGQGSGVWDKQAPGARRACSTCVPGWVRRPCEL